MILIFGCLRRVLTLVLLLVIGFLAWINRDRILEYWHRFRGQPPAATESPEDVERSARAKLAALESGQPPARTALSEGELQALMRTRLAPSLPDWVDSARIRLEGDRVRLSGRVPVDHLPQVEALGQVAGLLPDTTEVAVTGQVIPLTEGRIALAVDQVTAAHIPVPRRLIAPIVARLKRPGDNTPGDALTLPLPRTIRSAYVRDDSLILLSGGRGGAGAGGMSGRPPAR